MVRSVSYLFIPNQVFVSIKKKLVKVREEKCADVVQGNEENETATGRTGRKSRRKDVEIKVSGENVG